MTSSTTKTALKGCMMANKFSTQWRAVGSGILINIIYYGLIGNLCKLSKRACNLEHTFFKTFISC